MRHKTMFVLVFVAGVVAAGPIAAQAQDSRVHFNFGAGFTAPNSEVRDRLGDGYNFNFGLDVAITPVISVEGLYSFNGLGQKRIEIPVSPVVNPLSTQLVPTDFFTDMNMQYGTGSVILQVPEGKIRPYGLVGMGVYYRPIKVTTPGVGFVGGYCDPWLYICYPGGWTAVENIVGERSSTDFGMAFGGGVKFGPVYAELRYHYIWGPTIEGPATVTNPIEPPPPPSPLIGHKANGQFLATTFGVRF
jgi:opacity protein-like surface antigen